MTSISATPLPHFFLRSAVDKFSRSDCRLHLLETDETRKAPYFKGFRAYFPSTLDINTTVSTWLDTSIMMSGCQGSRCLYVETYQGDFTFAETVPKAHSYLYYMQQVIWTFFAIVSTLIFNLSTCRSCCKICNN